LVSDFNGLADADWGRPALTTNEDEQRSQLMLGAALALRDQKCTRRSEDNTTDALA
jgi:hypothetical protein